MRVKRSPSEVVALTKKILKEAGEFFNKAPGEITAGQFTAMSNGRMSERSIANLGTSFGALKNYLYPSDKTKVSSELRSTLEKILKNAK